VTRLSRPICFLSIYTLYNYLFFIFWYSETNYIRQYIYVFFFTLSWQPSAYIFKYIYIYIYTIILDLIIFFGDHCLPRTRHPSFQPMDVQLCLYCTFIAGRWVGVVIPLPGVTLSPANIFFQYIYIHYIISYLSFIIFCFFETNYIRQRTYVLFFSLSCQPSAYIFKYIHTL